MRREVKFLLCLSVCLLLATTTFAAKTELFALDGRSLFVDENQIEVYTAPGMGWYLEKPVTMYARDGRTIVVAVQDIEAYKAVGWFLEGELETETEIAPPKEEQEVVVVPEQTEKEETEEKVSVKYTDGTVVSVPAYHVEMYKALGWTLSDQAAAQKVTMYNSEGVAKEVSVDEVLKYELAGWSKEKPEGEKVTLFYHDGSTKEVFESAVAEYNKTGWYGAYDEAVYAYAAFGDGKEVLGATKLLEDKKYEMAFNMVQDALDKLENTDSEYVPMLYYLRNMVTSAWAEAAKSPLGFINYWFSEKDGNWLVVFEYRNVSSNRIHSFRINFDICNEAGEVIETNAGSYYISDLQMTPCEKKRVAWIIKKGEDAKSIKNLKVKEVVFSDDTKWTAE